MSSMSENDVILRKLFACNSDVKKVHALLFVVNLKVSRNSHGGKDPHELHRGMYTLFIV